MDTSTSLAERLDLALKSIHLMINDLPDVARDWSTMDSTEKASWGLDWWQVMMSDLPLLEKHFRLSEMTKDQEMQYRRTLGKLRDSLALLDRLGLDRPTVLLGD